VPAAIGRQRAGRRYRSICAWWLGAYCPAWRILGAGLALLLRALVALRTAPPARASASPLSLFCGCDGRWRIAAGGAGVPGRRCSASPPARNGVLPSHASGTVRHAAWHCCAVATVGR
jgi:hypothetical protein